MSEDDKKNHRLATVPSKDTGSIRDSGKRETFSTGAVRDVSRRKGRFDLLPYAALRRLAVWFEEGARKYAARNWERGMPLTKYFNSAMRHAFAHLCGLRDEDHAAAFAWNAFCYMETEARIKAGILPKELYDIPEPLSAEAAAKSRGMIETVFEPVVPKEAEETS